MKSYPKKSTDGYSGIIFDRPAFKEMMQDITDGKINCVIVKDLSRLGREYIGNRALPAAGVSRLWVRFMPSRIITTLPMRTAGTT